MSGRGTSDARCCAWSPTALFLLLLGCALLPTTQAWLVQSVEDTTWATGYARYAPLRRPVMIGTNFYDGTTDEGPLGGDNNGTMLMDTDCTILVADSSGHWVKHDFETPQYCVGGATVLHTPEANTHRLGTAIVVGLDGAEASIVTMGELAEASQVPGQPFLMDVSKMPVSITEGAVADPFVYVAMHDTNGAIYQGFGVDRSGNLKGINEYWKGFTEPKRLASIPGGHRPEILQINPVDGTLGFRSVFSLSEGATATISDLAYDGTSIVAIGSTNGSGDSVGGSGSSVGWDGFITFINTITGKPIPLPGQGDDTASIRVEWGPPGTNNYLHDMCIIPGRNFFYVVGTSDPYVGSPLGDTYILKVNLSTRAIDKQVKIDLTSNFDNRHRGLKIVCDVNHVFVGGHIEFDESVFDQEQTVFVAAIPPSLDEIKWEVLLDSSAYFSEPRTDQLVELEVNPLGGVNALWNSQNLNKGINHVLLVDMDKDTGDNDLDESSASGGGLENADFSDSSSSDDNDLSNREIKKEKLQIEVVLLLAIGLPLLLCIFVCIYHCRYVRSQPDKTLDTSVDHELQLQEDEQGKSKEVV